MNRDHSKTANTLLRPPAGYVKKIVRPGDDLSLSASFEAEQIRKRVAFYRELRDLRESMRVAAAGARGQTETEMVSIKFNLLGWENTTTVRVYMRETVTKIAENLFFSDYSLNVRNVKSDRDHGYVEVSLSATRAEHETLEAFIFPGASYFVYDGERAKYVPGDTGASEFIITRPGGGMQPERYWRRSQSFIAGIEKSGTTESEGEHQ